MKRLEALAAAYPLHVQRIAELTDRDYHLSQPSRGAKRDLLAAFEFKNTDEGHQYWWALYSGRGLK